MNAFRRLSVFTLVVIVCLMIDFNILILYFQLSMDAGEGNGDNVSLKRQRTPLSDSEDSVLSPGVCAIQPTTNQCLQLLHLSMFFN